MFRVTKLADYGVLLMSWLSTAESKHRLTGIDEPMPPRSAADLARQTGLPAPTVSKLLRQLARKGLLDSTRGVQGGYRLARASDSITVAELIEAVEGPIALTECLNEDAPDCGMEAICPTKANWGRINAAIRGALANITLAEMAPSAFQTPVAPVVEAALPTEPGPA